MVLGNEDRGISDEVKELCDHKIYLPMRGFAQSFSLSVGCAAMASHLNAVRVFVLITYCCVLVFEFGVLSDGMLSPQLLISLAFNHKFIGVFI